MTEYDDALGTIGLGDDGTVQVRFRRHLPHPVEQVWASLVDPAQQATWMPGCTFEARAGAPVLFDFGDEGRAEGEVLVAEAPTLLEHTWLWPGEPRCTVRYELEPVDGGTVLTLTQRRVAPEPAVDYCTGWHVMLDALTHRLDGNDPGAVEPDFAGLYRIYAAQNR